ncbi:MAG: hypothetical protein KGR26_10885 [Cyanobacteria bacterium REEB65]|nr:hypothetical protein [Cyanobacteria bacterium REEB65]MDE2103852.1 hypothetical protein [Patescibacteria group bacterium]
MASDAKIAAAARIWAQAVGRREQAKRDHDAALERLDREAEAARRALMALVDQDREEKC